MNVKLKGKRKLIGPNEKFAGELETAKSVLRKDRKKVIF
jgi:hypothetical protein